MHPQTWFYSYIREKTECEMATTAWKICATTKFSLLKSTGLPAVLKSFRRIFVLQYAAVLCDTEIKILKGFVTSNKNVKW